MFENVLGQSGADQLAQDIAAGILAPAMLFSGPPASGKGTSALELGRVISCEAADSAPGNAAWNCGCSACSRHRLLIHPDILCLGPRAFSAEIAASAGAFLRDTGASAARTLFIRAVRKLLARFNPAFWGDTARGGKSLSSVTSLVNSLEEDLDELERLSLEQAKSPPPENQDSGSESSLVKLTDRILKNAFKLESEGVSDTVPVGQLRRAAYWCHLAPAGRGKLLVIENADRMQDEARNSLLKLLEEPPPRVTLVLTTARPGSLLPTIRSRLRPYRFQARTAETEGEVIRRVFRDKIPAENAGEEFSRTGRENRIGAYLDSFLPVSGDTLEALAAFFAASTAYRAALLSKRQGRSLPEEVVRLGKYCAPKAEAAGFGRPRGEGGAVVSVIIAKTDKFEIRSLFSRFLSILLEQVSRSQSQTAFPFLPSLSYNELWKDSSDWALGAVLTYKLSPALALEKYFTDLSRGMAAL